MTDTSAPPQAPAAARAVMAMLQRIPHGQLDLLLPGATQPLTFGRATDGTEHAGLQVHDNRVFGQALRRGDIGFAESYIAGQWDSPHLADLITLLARNHQALSKPFTATAWAGGCIACAMRCAATHATTAAKTFMPTTTWATIFIGCGWTKP